MAENEPKLTLPQARVLAALEGEPPPLLGRARIAELAGFTPISGTPGRVLYGVQEGSSSGRPHQGLLSRGLVERLEVNIDGHAEVGYRITPGGRERLRTWLAENGPLPPLKDRDSTTNRRYKQGGSP